MKIRHIFSLFFLLILTSQLFAQERTVGLIRNEADAFDGYTLFSCIFSDEIYLIDNCGNVVHDWNDLGVPLANSAYLMEDGRLFRTGLPSDADTVIRIGGGGDMLMIQDWEGNVEWEFRYNDANARVHHDIHVMPNGNFLALTWENYDSMACIQAGRDPSKLVDGKLFPDGIIEVEPTGPTSGNIVWKWSLWDHLIQDFDSTKDNFGDPAAHPELLDLNFISTWVQRPGEADWTHCNSIHYNEDLDQIVIGSQRLSEIWILDHSTSTSEAAGHSGGRYGKGGDFLWRWGNPQAYRAGDETNRQLFAQHDAYWIPSDLPDGDKIMIFNNGLSRSRSYSDIPVVDAAPDAQGFYHLDSTGRYGPESPDWQYIAPTPEDFHSYFISGSRRLPNGNTLICEGESGHFFEVTYDGEIVWEYINPLQQGGAFAQGDSVTMVPFLSRRNATFRAERYPTNYAAFAGRDLSPKGTVELDPWETECITDARFSIAMILYPSISNDVIHVDLQNVFGNYAAIRIYDEVGKEVYATDLVSENNTIDVSDWRPGLYFCKVGNRLFRRFVVAH